MADLSRSTYPAQRFNALKHGRYAETVLLPEDDPAEFARRRRAAFHCYRPQTEDEALMVDALVEHRWRLERWRPLQTLLDGQAVYPAVDAAGRVTEPDAHLRLHSSMDATIHRARMDRLWNRALTRLLVLQDHRRKGLILGALKLPADCYMDTDGHVYGPIAPRVIVPLPEPDLDADSTVATHSTVTPIGNFQEQEIEAGLEDRQSIAGPVGRASAGGLPEAPSNAAPASSDRSDIERSHIGIGGFHEAQNPRAGHGNTLPNLRLERFQEATPTPW